MSLSSVLALACAKYLVSEDEGTTTDLSIFYCLWLSVSKKVSIVGYKNLDNVLVLYLYDLSLCHKFLFNEVGVDLSILFYS
jgi:hypothetical protein